MNQKLMQIINQEMTEWYANQPNKDKGHIGGYCLWWAYFTVKILREAGLDAQIQAGSAFWPILTKENDDGISPNQFGYKFELNNTTIMRVLNGELPEMHVWAALAKEGIIIDAATRFWPERCKHLIGAEWQAPKPPDFLCATVNTLPKGVAYIANVQAIQIAYQILRATNHETNRI